MLKTLVPLTLCFSFGSLMMGSSGGVGRQPEFPQASSQSEVVNFCALVDHPAEYRDRTIRVKVILIELNKTLVDGGEPTLYDPACRNKRIVGVHWSHKSYDDSTAAASLREIRERHSDEFQVSRASVVMSGTLSGPRKGGFGHLGGLDLLFTVDDVESAEPVPQNVRWPKRDEDAYRRARKLFRSDEPKKKSNGVKNNHAGPRKIGPVPLSQSFFSSSLNLQANRDSLLRSSLCQRSSQCQRK